MNPIEFEGCNVVYAKDQPEYLPLPAKKDEDGTITTCWELTPEELNILRKTGKVYITMLTFNQPLQPIRPYVQDEERHPPLFSDLDSSYPGLEKYKEAYDEFCQCLTPHLLTATVEMMRATGIVETWKAMNIEIQLPDHMEQCRKAFSYMNYLINNKQL